MYLDFQIQALAQVAERQRGNWTPVIKCEEVSHGKRHGAALVDTHMEPSNCRGTFNPAKIQAVVGSFEELPFLSAYSPHISVQLERY
ncbi:hypothetical protein JZ751_001342 [Albula glossodonta]|uniref:Uncharacterized protein n=1 Tax=Albula glossodonta TaxID=121402 RepID=A0A8T2PTH1_9TELE|nr:hypothetical protein JZ751_001342 [Albula glossodonta]